MVARRHHYLPQCYLRGFVRHRDKPKLFVVDRDLRKAFFANPINVAQERDFHAVQAEGLPSDAIEKALAGFESDLAPALARVAQTGSMRMIGHIFSILLR